MNYRVPEFAPRALRIEPSGTSGQQRHRKGEEYARMAHEN
jgi:hypothetical protein